VYGILNVGSRVVVHDSLEWAWPLSLFDSCEQIVQRGGRQTRSRILNDFSLFGGLLDATRH
jgi:hypothetical protein